MGKVLIRNTFSHGTVNKKKKKKKLIKTFNAILVVQKIPITFFFKRSITLKKWVN